MMFYLSLMNKTVMYLWDSNASKFKYREHLSKYMQSSHLLIEITSMIYFYPALYFIYPRLGVIKKSLFSLYLNN